MTEITKEDFREYERVRKQGTTNMLEFGNVSKLTGISEEKVRKIVKNYDDYSEQFPEVIEE